LRSEAGALERAKGIELMACCFHLIGSDALALMEPRWGLARPTIVLLLSFPDGVQTITVDQTSPSPNPAGLTTMLEFN
jgi:hypothetical protein